MNSLVVNSWTFSVQHYAYVVLSRVKKLKSLVLNPMLDENHYYKANGELMRWESNIKKIEKKHSKIGVNLTMTDI